VALNRLLISIVTIVLSVLFMLTSGPVGALSLEIRTQMPEFLLDGNLTLNGTANATVRSLVDNTDSNFQNGTFKNVSITNDSVLLKPELDFNILNGGNAVFGPGTGDVWDTYLASFNVVRHNGTYYMYYTGMRSTALTAVRHIGLATSQDGINWTRYSKNPVISSRSDSYDSANVMRPVVLVENNTWRMWYAGNDGNKMGAPNPSIDICHATSKDGKNWTKHSQNPVLRHGAQANAWNGWDIRPCGIINEGASGYRLYYYGVGSSNVRWLGLAKSEDGVTWTNNPNNPLRRGDPNGWESGWTLYSTLEKANGTYRLWSNGGQNPWRMGWVCSADGVDWVDSGGPVMIEKAGTVYGRGFRSLTVFDEGSHYLMFVRVIDDYYASRYAAFRVTPKKLDGEYTSGIVNASGRVRLINLTWTVDVPSGGYLEMYLRWGNNTSNLTSWKIYKDGAELANITAQYFQYRALFKASKDWTRVQLHDVTLTYRIPVRVVVRVDDGQWRGTDGPHTNWTVNVQLQDGDHNVTVRAIDAVGSLIEKTFKVKVDLHPPTGNITLEEGRWATNSTLIGYALSANDTHGVPYSMASLDPTFSGINWSDFLPSGTVDYGGLDGNVTVYARFKDGAGRVSEIVRDSIIVDTTPPEGTLVINDGAKYTRSALVRLAIDWSDLTGVIAMKVSNDPDFSQVNWMDPTRELMWDLDDVQGSRAVFVRLKDAVGLTTTITDGIIFDRTPPIASMVINNDALYTVSTRVSLNVTLFDENPVSVKFANKGDGWPIEWQTLETPTTVPWVLLLGDDGPREVKMLSKDDAGNEVVVVDDIVLDTTPPLGDLTLNDGARFTTDTIVRARLECSDATSDVVRMRASNVDDFSNVSWQSVKGQFNWLFQSGDGRKTLYIQIKDSAGHVTTLEDSIILDTTPPSGNFMIGDGRPYVADPSVMLYMDFTDTFGVSEMRVSDEPSFTSSPWRAYTSACPWTLRGEEDEHTFYVEVKDHAGNTLVVSDTVILDYTIPTATLVIEAGTEATVELEVELTWTAQDDYGLGAFRFSASPDFEGADWQLFGSTPGVEPLLAFSVDAYPFLLSGADGLKTVYLQVRDIAGWMTTVSDEIWYISNRPGGELVLGDGSGWTRVSSVEATIVRLTGSPATHVRFSTTKEGLDSVEWTPLDRAHMILLNGPDGPYRTYAQLLGPRNVTSIPFWATITLDTKPSIVSFSPPLTNKVKSERQTFNFTVTDNLDPDPRLAWRIDGGKWHDLANTSFVVTLEYGEHTVEVRAVDAAGNVAVEPWEIERVRGEWVLADTWLWMLIIIIMVVLVPAGYYLHRRRLKG
jgi:hypothetical protein